MAQPGLLTSVSALIVAAHLIRPFSSASATYPKEFQLILFVSWFSLSESKAVTSYLEGRTKLPCQGKKTYFGLLCVSLVETHALQGQGETGDLLSLQSDLLTSEPSDSGKGNIASFLFLEVAVG